MKKFFLLLTLLFCAKFTVAQFTEMNIDTSAINMYIQKNMAKKQVPGVSYVIVKDGKIIAQYTFGVTKHGGKKVTASTPFALPFINNSFLTISILQLEEKGLLDLDDAVIKHVPWFTLKDTDQSNKITIRHLLYDQSGINTLDGETLFKKADASANAMENLVREFSSFELAAEPGKQFIISNANYSILSLLLEEISGQPHEEYYQEHILTPLGMDDSFVNNLSSKIANRAAPHRYWFGQAISYEPKPNRRLAMIYASSNDVAKYMTALLQKDERLLSATGYNTIFNTQIENRGPVAYGWFRFGDTNSNFGTNGISDGTTCAMTLFTDQRIGIAVFANAVSGFGWVKPEELVFGPMYIIQGKSQPNWSYTLEIILYIVAFVIPLIFLFLIARLVHNKIQDKTNKRPSSVNLWLSLLGSILLAWFLIYYLPTEAGFKPVPIEVVLLYLPDLAWALILGGIFAIIWALLRIILAYLPNNNSNQPIVS